jgi:hypothetical protein
VISWQVRPGELMRDYGLGYATADRIIRHHTRLHWRRFGWIGGIALAMLVVYLGGAFLGEDIGPFRPLLLGGAVVGTGLQLWLAQRAAYPAILQEAAELRDGGGHPHDR